MRVNRPIVFLLTVLISLFSLVGCEDPIELSRHPMKFPGSKWATENNEITFFVENIHVSLPKVAGTQGHGDSDNPYLWFFARGTIDIDGVKREVYFDEVAGTSNIYIFFVDLEELAATTTEFLYHQNLESAGYFVATIECDHKSKKHFEAVVTESEYLIEGQKFIFRRVE